MNFLQQNYFFGVIHTDADNASEVLAKSIPAKWEEGFFFTEARSHLLNNKVEIKGFIGDGYLYTWVLEKRRRKYQKLNIFFEGPKGRVRSAYCTQKAERIYTIYRIPLSNISEYSRKGNGFHLIVRSDVEIKRIAQENYPEQNLFETTSFSHSDGIALLSNFVRMHQIKQSGSLKASLTPFNLHLSEDGSKVYLKTAQPKETSENILRRFNKEKEDLFGENRGKYF